eukprot:TRINITY_DN418_c0_g1_i1.p1 TRINITY_DN418_c0_g1~~TRINITY_DN418_c0_g1_i1.p1  ORF type:complete len:143 (+),score=5.46 TRINITY_DN418_c0_g1_i1:72-500(+)
MSARSRSLLLFFTLTCATGGVPSSSIKRYLPGYRRIARRGSPRTLVPSASVQTEATIHPGVQFVWHAVSGHVQSNNMRSFYLQAVFQDNVELMATRNIGDRFYQSIYGFTAIPSANKKSVSRGKISNRHVQNQTVESDSACF